MQAEIPTTDGYAAYIGIKPYDGNKPYLMGTFSWLLVHPDGTQLADGEGCLSRGEAAETAAKCAKSEFGLDV